MIVAWAAIAFIGVGLTWNATEWARARVLRGTGLPPRAYSAAQLVIGLVGALLASGWLAGRYGDVEEVRWLEGPNGPRLAVLYTRSGRGSRCRIRTSRVADGSLVGQAEMHAATSCASSYAERAIVWIEGSPSSISHDDAKNALAFDLYEGRQVADVAEAVDAAMQEEMGFRIRWSESANGHVVVQLQNGEVAYVTCRGDLVPASSPTADLAGCGDAAPSVPHEGIEAPDGERRFRVRTFPSSCGCAPDASCGELIRYDTTAFGEGTTHLALVDSDGSARWDLPWPVLVGEDVPLMGLVGTERCTFVGSGDGRVDVVTIDRRTGRVSSHQSF